MNYLSTSLEDLVQELYEQIGIKEQDWDIAEVANKLGIHISYWYLPFSIPGNIILNPLHSKEKQKETFVHELFHNLYHVGSQLGMPEQLRQLQEYKARNFTLLFAVPTHLLHKMEWPQYRSQAIDLIAKTFGVTHRFADKRLEHYERQVNGALFYDKLLQKCAEPAKEYRPKEIDVYGDLPYDQTPEFKDFIKSLKAKGISDKGIQSLIRQLKLEMSLDKTNSQIG